MGVDCLINKKKMAKNIAVLLLLLLSSLLLLQQLNFAIMEENCLVLLLVHFAMFPSSHMV